MAKIFKKTGLRYESQPKLPGKPDFRLVGTRILIFCDSSFWHGRRPAERSGKAFKRNKAYWIKKLRYNAQRDVINGRRLRRAGWSVLRFWDSDVFKKPERVARKLKRAFNARKSRRANRY